MEAIPDLAQIHRFWGGRKGIATYTYIYTYSVSCYGKGMVNRIGNTCVRQPGIMILALFLLIYAMRVQGHIVQNWKARCFVLQRSPDTLSYFDPSKKVPKVLNSLPLRGATVHPVDDSAVPTGRPVICIWEKLALSVLRLNIFRPTR